MSGKYRLAQGGRIDRSKPIKFRFDGREFEGFEGDTLASALLANGVRVVGRSFKYHRPRGLIAEGVEEFNAIVQLGSGAATEPNLKATLVPLQQGLEARAVNAWPNASFDLRAVIDLFHHVLPAGFYYKTFMWPRWNFFSRAIRNVAGLGQAPRDNDPSTYDQKFAHCDVLVIGAGPAGLAAARAASDSGARVILVEMRAELGGSLLAEGGEIDGNSALHWLEATARTLSASRDLTVLTRTTAFGYYDHNLVACTQHLSGTNGKARQRIWKIRAKEVVMATGAFERPLVFPGNDCPGVMLASAARSYLNRFAVKPGDTAAIVTNNDSAYDAAIDLANAGVRIAAILDARLNPQGEIVRTAREKGLRILAGSVPIGVSGRSTVKALKFGQIDDKGAVTPSGEVTCDVVCMSGGWSPAVHLFSQSGGRLKFDDKLAAFVPDSFAQSASVAGAALGAFSLRDALATGARAGAEAVRRAGFEPRAMSPYEVRQRVEEPLRPLWSVKTSGRAWVDFLNDVTADDVKLAARENYISVEHLKRYTTTGMAVDQGKLSNINAIGVLSDAIATPIPQIGTTKFRPPFDPVTFGAIAGRRVDGFYHVTRRLPAHSAHQELGAMIEDYGGWLRPAFYPLQGETEETAVRRETLAVRNAVETFDASPLGKIRVRGAGATEFLNRVYLNTIKTIQPGKTRYCFMLREDGTIFDDGVLLRIAENDWQVGTTSGKAAAVAHWLEEWSQCEWPDLDLVIENVTTAWATITVTGPKARDVLSTFDLSINLSDAALPHLGFADGTIEGVECRIARVSFTGERSYEVSVRADYGESLWRALLEAGKPQGIIPFGVEALMRLRMEKGYLHIGADTDATTYPQDIGYGKVLANKQADFVGRRSTSRSDAQRADRHQFVGIEPVDPSQPIAAGAHIVSGTNGTPERSQGWVTSSGFSPTLGRHVALAMVERGASRHGELVSLFHQGQVIHAKLAAPCAIDPEGKRLNA